MSCGAFHLCSVTDSPNTHRDFGSLLSLDHHLFTIDDVDSLLSLGQSLAGYIIDGSVGVAF